MTQQKINIIASLMFSIADITNSDVENMVDELIGIAWNEKDAGKIKQSITLL